MRVSYLETFLHCKKVFEACGCSYGIAEDGAEMVAWGEFAGLAGLTILANEVATLQSSSRTEIQLLVEKEDVTLLDGGGQSSLLVAKAVADYALSKLGRSGKEVLVVQNTSASKLLATQASYVASKGKGCVISYHTHEKKPVLLLATQRTQYPVVIEGRAEHDLLDRMSKEFNQDVKLGNDQSNGFTFICTEDLSRIDRFIEEILDEPFNSSIDIYESKKMENQWKKSWENGAEVDRELWDELYKTGSKILVESTEQSRLRGAGELA
ncbi:DUF3726 domain-containing protein [Sporosarcina soli]|uniref:DUF3726 domain-containing protein n=1 Tax=Sporosarcina soli TaxID=334736 RepID=A0ABW0TJN3_9BACL